MGRRATSYFRRVIRELLPRLALSAIFATGAIFAFYESVYLGDQSREIGDASIVLWMWFFRLVVAACALASIAFLAGFVRSLITR